MTRTKALLVDDHPIISEALLLALRNQGLFDEITTASTLQEAQRRLAEESDMSLVVLDLHMSDSEGVQAMLTLREEYPDTPVIIFSGDDSEQTITKAFECGVRGYVPKSSNVPVVISAIKMVMSGGSYIPGKMMEHLGYTALEGNSLMKESSEQKLNFTPRQQQVFEYLLQGMPNKIIASRLDMAEGTVKTHLNSVYRVLGVNNRAQAILKAQQLGIL